ncbi:hypothetical protein HY58_01910 [Flavihumibacter sp. ZG627]|nr:hypothetical protein HY58_01910 [Flavihumibacter sp. ZG627]
MASNFCNPIVFPLQFQNLRQMPIPAELMQYISDPKITRPLTALDFQFQNYLDKFKFSQNPSAQVQYLFLDSILLSTELMAERLVHLLFDMWWTDPAFTLQKSIFVEAMRQRKGFDAGLYDPDRKFLSFKYDGKAGFSPSLQKFHEIFLDRLTNHSVYSDKKSLNDLIEILNYLFFAPHITRYSSSQSEFICLVLHFNADKYIFERFTHWLTVKNRRTARTVFQSVNQQFL